MRKPIKGRKIKSEMSSNEENISTIPFPQVPNSPPTDQQLLHPLFKTKRWIRQSIVPGISVSELQNIFEQIRDPQTTALSVTSTGLTVGQLLRLHRLAFYKKRSSFYASRPLRKGSDANADPKNCLVNPHPRGQT